VLGEAPVNTLRLWTWMVYMAGDNNLEHYGGQDLTEMKAVGSTPEVAIVAQFDRQSPGDTQRYYLHRGTALEEDVVPGQKLGETNTGDPRDLAQFIHWAISAYPAERYALIIWNHGTGWKEDDIYQRAVRQGWHRAYDRSRLAALVRRVSGCVKGPLFITTLGAVLAHGIAYDDTSADFLDNSELKRALDAGLLFGAVDRLDLLGFDACLMAMLETAYQVKGFARWLVASQETEPGDGWPYLPILRRLVAQPTLDGLELARGIPSAYIESYAPDANLTLSVMDLDQCWPVTEALSSLSRYALDHLADCELIIGRAARQASKFTDPDYKDLYDLCQQIAERAAAVPELRARALAVMALLSPPEEGKLVVEERRQGARMVGAHGVSIYYPTRGMSPFYKRLDFASESLWDDLLHALMGV
jgi:hypothetical protein